MRSVEMAVEGGPAVSGKPHYPCRLTIGIITAPRGLKGEVRVKPLTDDYSRFQRLEQVQVVLRDGSCREVAINGVRLQEEAVLLTLRGIENRQQAEVLRGATLQVDWSQKIPLPEGHYFYFELVGLRVHTEEGVYIGQLVDILSPGPHDVYVVQGPHGEILVPAVQAFVREIDTSGGHMVIRCWPGLLQE